MEYVSHNRIESKVCAGVVFTILVMSYRRRQALKKLQAEAYARVEALRKELAPLSKEYSAAVARAKAAVQPRRDELVAGGMTPAQAALEAPLGELGFDDAKFARMGELGQQIETIDREELTPMAVRFALRDIDGLTIDGEPGTLELLMERGPDELYNEIAMAVAASMGLLATEQENLGSPSTSAAAVDGSMAPGTAASAGQSVTTISAGAQSTTDPGCATVLSTA